MHQVTIISKPKTIISTQHKTPAIFVKMTSVWCITGASNGIGKVLALRVLEAGHQVIAAMRNPSKSADAVEEVEKAGGKVLQLDMTESQDGIAKKMKVAESIFGRIDILVNNAGYSLLGPLENFR